MVADEDRNWSQVRKDTDSGKTGDKVDFPDPAAAPLGTDEEAGGEHTPNRAAGSAEAERSRDLPPSRKKIPVVTWAVLAVIAVIVLFLLI